jgi:sec-independent protein translocase protein TatC
MALVSFKGAAAPDPDDERQIQLTDPEDIDDGSAKMSFLDHLDELRKRLIGAALALLGGCVVSFFFVNRIQAFIMVPLARYMPPGEGFIYTDGFEPFMLWMKIGALGGLMIASPFIIWQFWLFIAPGLYSHEKRFAIPFVLFSTIFFVIGAAFSHYVAFPWTWQFFIGWQTDYLRFMPSIGPAFSTYVKMLLAFGVIFQLPTLVFFLARMGVVTAGMLIRNTKYAVLIIFILGAVLSPGTDVVSQALMAGPMLVLYGFSIGVAWVFAKKKPAKANL